MSTTGKWMPAEPTETMIAAGVRAIMASGRASNAVCHAYRAMYDAFASPVPGSPADRKMIEVLTLVADDFERRTNPGDSDLDNEQPYHITLPLGACRAARSIVNRARGKADG